MGLKYGPIDVWNNIGVWGCMLQICRQIAMHVAHLHGFLLAVMCSDLPVTRGPTNEKLTIQLAKLQLETLIFGNNTYSIPISSSIPVIIVYYIYSFSLCQFVLLFFTFRRTPPHNSMRQFWASARAHDP